MPIWEPSLAAAGFDAADVDSPIHTICRPSLDAPFLLHLDRSATSSRSRSRSSRTSPRSATCSSARSRVLPVRERRPRPERLERRGRRAPASAPGSAHPGAVRAAAGLLAGLRGRGGPRAAARCSAAAADAPCRRRPVGRRSRSAAARRRRTRPPPPVRPTRPQRVVLGALGRAADLAVRRPRSTSRARGDRAHVTGSAVAAGLRLRRRPRCRTCSSRRSPARSSTAGTSKEVLVVSDILRAAVVLLIPIAAIVNILLVYPLVFVVTAISIFFRPGPGRDPAAARRARTS